MSLETRLQTLERAATESAPQPEECITIDTVLGELQIPVTAFSALEKIYGNTSKMRANESQ